MNTNKSNYLAWNIDSNDFKNAKTLKDRLLVLISYAVLAPSSHNAQPWKFKIRKNKIFVYESEERSLPTNDVVGRQANISLGCALETIIIAANHFSLNTKVKYTSKNNNKIVAELSFVKSTVGKKSNKEPLFQLISRRFTDRGMYTNKFPDSRYLKKVALMSNKQFKIHFIKEPEQKKNAASLVLDAMSLAMDDSVFREELSHYIKSSNTKSKIGMPGFTIGLPFLPSLLAPYLIRKLNMSKLTRKKDQILLNEGTPMFGVITSEKDDANSQVEIGRMYMKIALEAEKVGLKTHVMAAAIEVKGFYKELQKLLKTKNRPELFFRVGYPMNARKFAHSPRLKAEEVTQI
jgi:hypothetical protein